MEMVIKRGDWVGGASRQWGRCCLTGHRFTVSDGKVRISDFQATATRSSGHISDHRSLGAAGTNNGQRDGGVA
jgi:hypothetical protein